MREVVVIGAGMHRYGVYPDKDFVELGSIATVNALEDAGMEWSDVQAAYCGHIGGGMSAGHQVFLSLGKTGVEITNIENASASGSTAFRHAYLAVASGACDVALALGADKLPNFRAMAAAAGQETKDQAQEKTSKPKFGPVHAFAWIAQEYIQRGAITREQLARISVKSHHNASMNPHAMFQRAMSLDEVLNARMVADPLTVPQCCPWCEGAAAAIVCAREVAPRFTTKPCPVVAASVCTSRRSEDLMMWVTDATRECAAIAYERAGLGVEDLNLIELHDAFTIEEVVYYEALGLCPEGGAGNLVDTGATEITGRHPVNTSGGLISVGHPNGPTGIGQIAEILWQMRGQAGGRQVENTKTGLAHMVGAGGVCVIHIFKK
jgi:acetyl-CoA acetyltransferase